MQNFCWLSRFFLICYLCLGATCTYTQNFKWVFGNKALDNNGKVKPIAKDNLAFTEMSFDPSIGFTQRKLGASIKAIASNGIQNILNCSINENGSVEVYVFVPSRISAFDPLPITPDTFYIVAPDPLTGLDEVIGKVASSSPNSGMVLESELILASKAEGIYYFVAKTHESSNTLDNIIAIPIDLKQRTVGPIKNLFQNVRSGEGMAISPRNCKNRRWLITALVDQLETIEIYATEFNGKSIGSPKKIYNLIKIASSAESIIGGIDISPDGSSMALCTFKNETKKQVILFDFNNETGNVSNERQYFSLTDKLIYPIVDFTSDSKSLLILSAGDPTNVSNVYLCPIQPLEYDMVNCKLLTNVPGGSLDMEVGPNKKLYVLPFNNADHILEIDNLEGNASIKKLTPGNFTFGPSIPDHIDDLYKGLGVFPDSIILSTSKPCLNETITAGIESDETFIYEWRLDGKVIGNTKNISFKITKNDTLYLTLINVLGCDITLSKYIELKPFQSAEFTLDADPCEGVIKVNPLVAEGYYLVRNDAGTIVGKYTNNQFTVKAGDYQIEHILNEGSPCASVFIQIVSIKGVQEIPDFEILNAPTSICKGDTVSLSIAMGNNFKISWQVNGTRLDSTKVFSYVPLTNSEVIVKVTSQSGCAKYDTAQIKVINIEDAGFVFNYDECSTLLTLNPVTNGGLVTIKNLNNNGIYKTDSLKLNVKPGKYQLSYTLNAGLMCSSETFYNTEFLDRSVKQYTILSNKDSLCIGDDNSITLSIDIPDSLSVKWYDKKSTLLGETNAISFSIQASDTIIADVFNNYGCSRKFFKPIYVGTKQDADFDFSYDLCTGYATINSNNVNGSLLVFDEKDSLIVDTESTKFPIDEGDYKIQFTTDKNQYCSSTSFKNVTVPPKKEIANPAFSNVFSLQSNSGNNKFCVGNEGIISKNDYTLQIYDRWGNLVFNTVDVAICWDGTFHGKLCTPGVYYYIMRYRTIECSDVIKTKMGDVTLIK